ncbi:MAG: hypothetical protein B7Z55_09655, partial [Planctomycetales bacterium 12-60-4]
MSTALCNGRLFLLIAVFGAQAELTAQDFVISEMDQNAQVQRNVLFSPRDVAVVFTQDGGGSAQGNNGTNPAQNVTTFIASNEYDTLDGNNRINTTYARLKFPIYEARGSFLLEMPFAYYNFTASFPNAPQIGGLGDLKLQGSYNTWSSDDKRFTMISFLEMFVPTADNALLTQQSSTGNELTAFNLGTGKFVIGPGVGLVYAPRPNFIIAPLYFFEASIFGNEDRADIRRGKLRIFGMYAWQNGVYTLPEFQLLTSYLSGNNDVYVAPEFGYSHQGTTLYVKPGVGINPDPNDREWGLEF